MWSRNMIGEGLGEIGVRMLRQREYRSFFEEFFCKGKQRNGVVVGGVRRVNLGFCKGGKDIVRLYVEGKSRKEI